MTLQPGPGRKASIRVAVKSNVNRLKERLSTMAAWVDERTDGSLSLIRGAAHSYSEMSSSEAAAGMTFYAIFSLFPLLALVVTLMSLLIEERDLVEFLHRLLTPVFPLSAEFLDQNIERFASQRRAVGILGTLGLIWSASSVFVILVHNINKAWKDVRVRNFLQRRLIALSLIVIMIVLLAVSLLAATILSILADLEPIIVRGRAISFGPLFGFFTPVLTFLITLLIFLFIYRFLPAAPVRFSDALWGAVLAAAWWQLTTRGLSWYLGSGLSYFDVLYGSITAVAILMFWLYLNNLMILFGAHLTAAISRSRTERPDAAIIKVRQPDQPG